MARRTLLTSEPWPMCRTRCLQAHVAERVWISCDPDERMIPALAGRYGADRFVWASDFPHVDHTNEHVKDLDELISLFPELDRLRFAGGNICELFKIDPSAVASR